jgi:hypothetical protein
MDARNRSLAEWFTRIASGQVQLPRFQRFEAWGHREIDDLMQTVIDELPAGDEPPFRARPLAGAPEPTERMTELLLDGQQRLTALWRALTETYPDRSHYIDISGELSDDEDEDEPRQFAAICQSRWSRGGKRYPVWCDDPRQMLRRQMLPARLLRPGSEGEKVCSDWLWEATGGDKDC